MRLTHLWIEMEDPLEKIKKYQKPGEKIELVRVIKNPKKPEPEKVDHPPCNNCGSTIFIKTGVCYTCALCADSTSCS